MSRRSSNAFLPELGPQPRPIGVFQALPPNQPILGIARRGNRELLVEIAPNV